MEFKWYAGDNDEFYRIGPCDTREEAISEAICNDVGILSTTTFNPEANSYTETLNGNGIWIVEASNPPVRIADYLPDIVAYSEDNIFESDRASAEYDSDGVFTCTPGQAADLQERVKKACDEWQEAHGLVFKVSTFGAMKPSEFLTFTQEESEAIYNMTRYPTPKELDWKKP